MATRSFSYLYGWCTTHLQVVENLRRYGCQSKNKNSLSSTKAIRHIQKYRIVVHIAGLNILWHCKRPGGDHSELSLHRCPSLLWNVTDYQSKHLNLCWLVRKPPIMSVTAQRKDHFQIREVNLGIRQLRQRPRGIRLLILFSPCWYLIATNPTMWNSWASIAYAVSVLF